MATINSRNNSFIRKYLFVRVGKEFRETIITFRLIKELKDFISYIVKNFQ